METPVKSAPAVWRFFRWPLFIAVALTTLGALFFAEEDWRGSRAWNRYQQERQAKGKSLDLSRLIPPQVPDAQNLALIPFFAKAETITLPNTSQRAGAADHFGWQADLTNYAAAFGNATADPARAAAVVLDALDAQEKLPEELGTANRRPSCRFEIDYENWSANTNAQEATMAHFRALKKFFRVIALRAEAEVALGRTDQALDDMELLFRADAGVRDEPLLISQLVGYAGIEQLRRPLNEGLAGHRWSDAQLRTLQERLQAVDVLGSTRRAFEGEREFCVNPFFNSGSFGPRGWNRMEQLNFNRAVEAVVLPRIDLAARRIDPALNRSCDAALTNLSQHAFLHHRMMLAMTLPSEAGGVCMKTANVQTGVDESAVACALERYRLAEGHYPDTLEALTPRFASELPHDVITGQPLKYRRTDNGGFILYSVGWNETDEGGQSARKPDGLQDLARGDWVYQYPD
jgi:hypothetical protein